MKSAVALRIDEKSEETSKSIAGRDFGCFFSNTPPLMT